MMNRKKSILFSLAIIGVAATMITAATSALFTDQVVSENNALEAGTLFLSVDGDCGPPGRTDGGGGDGGGAACDTDPFVWTGTFDNMAIGGTVTHTFTIVNEGSLPGDLAVTPEISAESPAGCFSIAVTTPGASSLAASNGAAGGADETQYTITATLDAAGTADDNDCQAATATATVTFDLEQQP
jgi:predicted ribosomally synthesized peptide with SipW-like signal peptide